jgi:hexosaminidase
VTPAGVFYGVQTFLGLITHKGQLITDLPEFSVVDYPRLPYRGLMLDTARSFIKN